MNELSEERKAILDMLKQLGVTDLISFFIATIASDKTIISMYSLLDGLYITEKCKSVLVDKDKKILCQLLSIVWEYSGNRDSLTEEKLKAIPVVKEYVADGWYKQSVTCNDGFSSNWVTASYIPMVIDLCNDFKTYLSGVYFKGEQVDNIAPPQMFSTLSEAIRWGISVGTQVKITKDDTYVVFENRLGVTVTVPMFSKSYFRYMCNGDYRQCETAMLMGEGVFDDVLSEAYLM